MTLDRDKNFLCNLDKNIIFFNRIIKKFPLQFCINGLTIMIGQLGLVWLTNRKTGRKNVN